MVPQLRGHGHRLQLCPQRICHGGDCARGRGGAGPHRPAVLHAPARLRGRAAECGPDSAHRLLFGRARSAETVQGGRMPHLRLVHMRYGTGIDPTGIDPTGIVKGWAIRRASELLAGAGSARHAINGGGDVLVMADPAVDEPWRVGVSIGAGAGSLVGVITGHNFSVATSGNTERRGEIRNPFTGSPSLTWSTVSVAGPDITEADAFATAAVAMGRPAIARLERLPGYEAIAVDTEGE